MKYKLVLLLMLGVGSCLSKDKMSFGEIDYSYDNGWSDAYSLRLFADGNCILAFGRSHMKYYSGKINATSLERIDSMYRKITACHPDSSYSDDVVDQVSYKIVVKPANSHFFVYGNTAPECLTEFSSILKSLKSIKLTPIDTTIAFSSLESFYPRRLNMPSSIHPPGK